MKTDSSKSWLKFLNPDELKKNLIQCSIFITAWEHLKDSIVDQILWFYTTGFSGDKHHRKDYHKKVIELDVRKKKDVIYASCLWLKNNEVIDDDDIETIDKIRKHRNFIAHEMISVLGSADVDVDLDLLDELVNVLGKIDRWWITEVEIPTNPESMQLDDIDFDNVFSVRMMLMQLISVIASGDDNELREIYEKFKNSQSQNMEPLATTPAE